MFAGTVLAERFFHFFIHWLNFIFFIFHFLSSKKEISDKIVLFFLPAILVLNISNFPVGLNYTITATMVGCQHFISSKERSSYFLDFFITVIFFKRLVFYLFFLCLLFFHFFERRDSFVQRLSLGSSLDLFYSN